ncbi:hypothetical protein N9948_01630 [bacterium]|nr:hypothetical protein [bacterium]
MCLMCVEYQKNRMNITEVKKALRELVITANPSDSNYDHVMDLYHAENLEEYMWNYKDKKVGEK